ncbi:hypothetical protein Tco_0820314 [Tanacetum coccineum]|uniref:Uncharacterized protein n=1 Tax=Tanacetum coccineum TaxID=301880 RepID=A0ABQ5A937_9ASTR
MTEMSGILRELTSSRTPKKVLVREEVSNLITKIINAISLIKMEKEKGVEGDKVAKGNVMRHNELEALEPIESPDKEFEKGTITLKSGKNKIDFVKVLALPSELEKNVEDDLDPITPINTVSKLILEWGERIIYHKEKEMEFNQWRSTVFDNKGSISENEGCECLETASGFFLTVSGVLFRVPDLQVIFDKKKLWEFLGVSLWMIIG